MHDASIEQTNQAKYFLASGPCCPRPDIAETLAPHQASGAANSAGEKAMVRQGSYDLLFWRKKYTFVILYFKTKEP